jgi:hypothetical protein
VPFHRRLSGGMDAIDKQPYRLPLHRAFSVLKQAVTTTTRNACCGSETPQAVNMSSSLCTRNYVTMLTRKVLWKFIECRLHARHADCTLISSAHLHQPVHGESSLVSDSRLQSHFRYRSMNFTIMVTCNRLRFVKAWPSSL